RAPAPPARFRRALRGAGASAGARPPQLAGRRGRGKSFPPLVRGPGHVRSGVVRSSGYPSVSSPLRSVMIIIPLYTSRSEVSRRWRMVDLRLENLSKTYPGGVQAVRGLTLPVGVGERLVLLGRSGCGKTRTLRLIAGLERPTSGEVYLGGKRANDEPPHRRGVAMVFQRPALYPHWNVRQKLAFGMADPGAGVST